MLLVEQEVQNVDVEKVEAGSSVELQGVVDPQARYSSALSSQPRDFDTLVVGLRDP